MRILTYNIAGNRGRRRPDYLERIAEVIREADPDVVGLQEVVHRRGGAAEPEAILERLTGMDAVFVPAHQFRHHCLGNAVLFREPIQETITHELPHSWPERRVLLEVRGNVRNLPVTVFCTHLVHMARAAARLRLAQAGAVAEQLRRCGQPHVLLGDLNAAPHSREMGPLRSATNGDAHMAGLRTWPATRPMVLYDHIWPGTGWKVESIEVLDDAVSDHRPLLAHLKWEGAPQIPAAPKADA